MSFVEMRQSPVSGRADTFPFSPGGEVGFLYA